MPTKHLEGRVAIVTGGAGGIGSALCEMYAEQGAKLVVTDTGWDVEGRSAIDSSRVKAVVEKCRAAGGEAVGIAGDIANIDFAEDVIRLALDTHGKLDILVCAHGILRERMIFNMLEEEWDEVVRVHLKGCFTVTKFAAIYWRQSRAGGRIIYFTSDAGIFGSSGQPNYSAAHAGKLGLMRSNAQALGRYGVTCNCIAPAASTRMTDRGRAVNREGRAPTESAEGTRMDPKAVAPIAVWLGSEEGGAVSGRVFGASGHRISVYHEPVQERALFTSTPAADIDWLFDNWERTMGQDRFYPPPKGMQVPAPATTPPG